jgi:hypothetical protein
MGLTERWKGMKHEDTATASPTLAMLQDAMFSDHFTHGHMSVSYFACTFISKYMYCDVPAFLRRGEVLLLLDEAEYAWRFYSTSSSRLHHSTTLSDL